MSPPRPATEVRSGSLGPGWPTRAQSANIAHPAGRPHTPPTDQMYATDVRQHHRLMPPGRGHNNGSAFRMQTTVNRTSCLLLADNKTPLSYSLSLRLPPQLNNKLQLSFSYETECFYTFSKFTPLNIFKKCKLNNFFEN